MIGILKNLDIRTGYFGDFHSEGGISRIQSVVKVKIRKMEKLIIPLTGLNFRSHSRPTTSVERWFSLC